MGLEVGGEEALRRELLLAGKIVNPTGEDKEIGTQKRPEELSV